MASDVESIKDWLLDTGVLDERAMMRFAKAAKDLNGDFEEHLIDIAYDSIDAESRREATQIARGSIPEQPSEVLFQCGFLCRDPVEMPEKIRRRLRKRYVPE